SGRFYEEKFGMRIVDRVGDSIFLRCWGDYYHYSLVIVPGTEPVLAAMAWRVSSPEALDAAVQRIEEHGVTGAWSEGGHRHGKAYAFTGPYGHTMKIFWEVDRFVAEPVFASIYPDRPEKRSGHAAAPRFLHH